MKTILITIAIVFSGMLMMGQKTVTFNCNRDGQDVKYGKYVFKLYSNKIVFNDIEYNFKNVKTNDEYVEEQNIMYEMRKGDHRRKYPTIPFTREYEKVVGSKDIDTEYTYEVEEEAYLFFTKTVEKKGTAHFKVFYNHKLMNGELTSYIGFIRFNGRVFIDCTDDRKSTTSW